jgi:predicted aspartyl protease
MPNLSYFRVCLALRFTIPAALALFALDASAQVTLSALQRSGYGSARIFVPRPNQLTVQATINGAKVNLIVDTGFSGDGIALDAGHARRISSGPGTDKWEGETATGKKLSVESRGTASVAIGNARIEGVPLTFGNFKGLRPADSFQTGTHINRDHFLGSDGFIGAGFLRTCSAVIDLHNRLLYLRPPGTGRVALGPALTGVGLAAVPFTQVGGNCITDVEINGAPTRLIMDTGATLTFLDSRFAQRIKASDFITNIALRDAAGVTGRATRQASLSSFKIAGVPVRVPNLQVTDLAIYSSSGGKVAGAMGMDILGQNWSIIDFGEQKLYIAAKGQ